MELEVGKVYFEISWASHEAEVPDIETYIYIGKDIFGGNPEEYFFQTSYSYEKHGNFAKLKDQNKKAQAEITLMRSEMIETLYDVNEVIEKLKDLEVKHGELFGVIKR